MKQKIFTLVMIVAFAFVANTTFAQGTKFAPYSDGTYSYTLPVGIGNVASTVGSVNVYLNSTKTSTTATSVTGNWTFSAGAVTPANGAATLTSDKYVFAINENSTQIDFTIHYASGLAAGTYFLHADIAISSGCTNNIIANIVVSAPPSIALKVTASSSTACPTLALPYGTATDNVAAGTYLGQTTDLTYVVAVTGTVPVGATFNYTFSIANTVNGAYTYSISAGSIDPSTGVVTGATSGATITARFTNATEIPTTNADAALASASGSLSAAMGSGAYTVTVTAPTGTEHRTAVGLMPAIGTFQ